MLIKSFGQTLGSLFLIKELATILYISQFHISSAGTASLSRQLHVIQILYSQFKTIINLSRITAADHQTPTTRQGIRSPYRANLILNRGDTTTGVRRGVFQQQRETKYLETAEKEEGIYQPGETSYAQQLVRSDQSV
jgi:hypothetical protein